LLFAAIGHGVDISILACTKYIVGHSDVMMGSATANGACFEQLRRTTHSLGHCVGPDDAYLATRGLRTLGVRMKAHEEGALKVARWLKAHPQVARVLHPAFPDCPGHALWQRDFTGSSGLFSVVMAQGDDVARAALIDGLHHFGIGFSWGGYESLVLPVDPAPIRSATSWAAQGPMIRLQIGLEDPDDLITDLGEGLERYAAALR
jgi:cystathionine beta-lyase